MLKRNIEPVRFGDLTFDGYIIVERPTDEEYYALLWNKNLAEKTAKFLSKLVK